MLRAAYSAPSVFIAELKRSAIKTKMPIIDEIRDALIIAAEEKTKTATLHSLVLIHSRELEKMEPLEFCRLAGITEAYQIEFRKMISASRKLRELGYSIQKK